MLFLLIINSCLAFAITLTLVLSSFLSPFFSSFTRYVRRRLLTPLRLNPVLRKRVEIIHGDLAQPRLGVVGSIMHSFTVWFNHALFYCLVQSRVDLLFGSITRCFTFGSIMRCFNYARLTFAVCLVISCLYIRMAIGRCRFKHSLFVDSVRPPSFLP
jgi:hypothetical protein